MNSRVKLSRKADDYVTKWYITATSVPIRMKIVG